MVAIVLAIYGIMALDMILKTKKINWILLVISTIALLGITSLSYFPDDSGINKNILNIVRFLLVIYAILLFFLSKLTNY